MKTVVAALAGLALTLSGPALAAPAKGKSQSKAASKGVAKKGAATSKPATPKPPTPKSDEATRVADWVSASADNHDLPYIIIDKKAARAFLFDAGGKQLADAPVLIGIAPGDDATPGIGAKSLAEIGPAEKTTPAGRFLAKFGIAAGNKRVLWVDYATSVALHTIPTGNPKEHRRDRMLSPAIDDNRITFGCINVPMAFYNKGVAPLFQKQGGYVYVLPDLKPIEAVFPRLIAQQYATAGN